MSKHPRLRLAVLIFRLESRICVRARTPSLFYDTGALTAGDSDHVPSTRCSHRSRSLDASVKASNLRYTLAHSSLGSIVSLNRRSPINRSCHRRLSPKHWRVCVMSESAPRCRPTTRANTHTSQGLAIDSGCAITLK